MAKKITLPIEAEVRSVRDITSRKPHKETGELVETPYLAVNVLPEDADEVIELFGPAEKWDTRPERGDQVVVRAQISVRTQEGFAPELSVWTDQVVIHNSAVKA